MEEGMSPEEYNELVVDLFRNPEGTLDPVRRTEDDILRDPRLAHGRPPRGLAEQGLVRTTGWLQLGTRVVSSGLVTALISLLISVVAAVTLLSAYPLVSGTCILLLPIGGYAVWYVITMRLVPASTARNIETVAVADLQPGTWIRLHGTIGPVGQVARVQSELERPLSARHYDVTFFGGVSMIWPSTHQVHVVDLRD
jgi:hypothetical protein